MVGVQVLADGRIDTGQPPADRLHFWIAASQPVHVRCGTAQVRDESGEPFHLVADFFDFPDDGVLRAALDDAPLMLGDRAECTAAETAPHDIHRETDHLPCRDPLIPIGGMWCPGIRQPIDTIHLFHREWQRRGIQPDITLTMCLHQRTGIARIRLLMQHTGRMGIQHRVILHLFERGQADHGPAICPSMQADPLCFYCLHTFRLAGSSHHSFFQVSRFLCLACLNLREIRIRMRFDRSRLIQMRRINLHPVLRWFPPPGHHECSSPQVADAADRLTGCHPVRQLDHRPFRIAIDQQVSLAVRQHRTADIV